VANDEHVALLRQGTATWNEWREQNLFSTASPSWLTTLLSPYELTDLGVHRESLIVLKRLIRRLPKRPGRPLALTAVALVAVALVFGLHQSGELKIGPWLDVKAPAVPGGNGGNANADDHGKAIGGAGGHAGSIGPGGNGGDAHASGPDSLAIGGPGGNGGIGLGGAGGSVQAGPRSIAAGGEGGEAAQTDGRGGRGGRNGYDAAGFPDYQLPNGKWLSDYGRGGNGANAPSAGDPPGPLPRR
jgi:hypothetical protein